MDGSTLGAAIALIKKNKPTDAQVESAVSDWLDDHPEATTTVQDGSITKAKLDENLQGTVDDVSDLKSAVNVLEPAATASDVGKFLKAKTISGGKVTEYEFGSGGGGGGGTDDYSDLSNKPQIGGVTLQGDKSLSDLGIQNVEVVRLA